MNTPNPRYMVRLSSAVNRLYFLCLGCEENVLYNGTSTPEEDQMVLMELMEEARNAWRTIRRGRSLE